MRDLIGEAISMQIRRRFGGAARAGDRLCAAATNDRRLAFQTSAGSLTARVKEEARDNGLPPFEPADFHLTRVHQEKCWTLISRVRAGSSPGRFVVSFAASIMNFCGIQSARCCFASAIRVSAIASLYSRANGGLASILSLSLSLSLSRARCDSRRDRRRF